MNQIRSIFLLAFILLACTKDEQMKVVISALVSN
jgi:hypothetical protein